MDGVVIWLGWAALGVAFLAMAGTVSTLLWGLIKEWRGGKLGNGDAVADPEIESIIGELDAELAREFELVEDGLAEPEKVRDVGDLLRTFAQRCTKIALVGSRRRRVANPNDVDVLFIPKSNLQVVEFLEEMADDEEAIKCADNVWSCEIAGVPFHFIESSNERWGVDLIWFTGSRDFNTRVMRHATRRGIQVTEHNRLKFLRRAEGDYGYVDVPAFKGWDEARILKHLGLERYLDPIKR